MYGTDSSRFYEIQHRARGKDYDGEARVVVDEVKALNPEATSLLDVACGTGGHFDVFTKEFTHVEGVDLSEPMLEICRELHPLSPTAIADMRDFDLGRRFDVVTCLFASIAYLDEPSELDQVMQAFVRHLNPGGVVAIEPWWTVDRFIDGWVSSDVVELDGMTLLRASHSRREGRTAVMDAHYVAADNQGIHHLAEVHTWQLFEREEYEAAFTRVGLDVRYVPDVLSGRGLFIGALH